MTTQVAWIRVGALGDLLVGLASLVETCALFPEASVTVLGPALWCEILAPSQFPQVRQIAAVERKGNIARLFEPVEDKWQATGEEKQVREVFSTCQAAVNTNIDSYRYGFAMLAAGVRVRYGSAPPSMAWLYNHCSPFFGKDPVVHERDAALLILDYSRVGVGRFLHSVARNREELTKLVNRSVRVAKWRKLGLPPGKVADFECARRIAGCDVGRYVVVNPTSSRREKAWPADSFRELLKRAKAPLAAQGIELLVTGSPKETEWLREVAGNEFRVVQPPTIRELQDLLSGSRGLVANTSSVQFIAAMTGTPAMTLMGRAVPAIWGPLGPHDMIVQGSVPEGASADIFEQETLAYRAIAVDDVLKALLSLPNLPRVR